MPSSSSNTLDEHISYHNSLEDTVTLNELLLPEEHPQLSPFQEVSHFHFLDYDILPYHRHLDTSSHTGTYASRTRIPHTDRPFLEWDHNYIEQPVSFGEAKLEQDWLYSNKATSYSVPTVHSSTPISPQTEHLMTFSPLLSSPIPSTSETVHLFQSCDSSSVGFNQSDKVSTISQRITQPCSPNLLLPQHPVPKMYNEKASSRGPVSETYALPSFSEAYPCEYEQCNKSFRRSSELRKHAKTHIDKKARRFVCETCESRFYYSKDLKRHLKCVHQQSSSERHLCTDCGKSFIRYDKLQRHQKTQHQI
ncbi:hypothetical protein CC78DRAFT_530300 [Lojkania enalia]|uniref:C2H2-type domain-containing protein n=1 Tax=Lojkania enalia TaxID=147567 RepID=A0A9P4KFV7_9PLEO|nr:hypothetical protein CC78DRAFT_530300 [Didymosphaeria enalia]